MIQRASHGIYLHILYVHIRLYCCLYLLWVRTSRDYASYSIELRFRLEILVFHFTLSENSLFGCKMESQNKVHSSGQLHKMVSTTVNLLLPTRNPSSETKPAKRPGQHLCSTRFYSFLHSLGILYAYGYIFGGATLFGAAANATAHWSWYHCRAIDTYRLLFFLLEGIVYGEAPCAVVVHTVCCCWRTAAAVLFSLVVVAVVVVINCVCRLRTFFVHKYPKKYRTLIAASTAFSATLIRMLLTFIVIAL